MCKCIFTAIRYLYRKKLIMFIIFILFSGKCFGQRYK